MVALRSLDYEPQPQPSRKPPHWMSEREALLDERERELEWRRDEVENERPNYALEGGIGS